MRVGAALLVLLAVLLPLTPLLPGGSVTLLPHAPGPAGARGLLLADGSNSSSTDQIPPVVCPLAPVNTTFGPITCFQMIDLTEVFVILIGLTITFYVYKDADRAELPGDAAEVPVTAQEELEQRREREAEDAARAELESHRP